MPVYLQQIDLNTCSVAAGIDKQVLFHKGYLATDTSKLMKMVCQNNTILPIGIGADGRVYARESVIKGEILASLFYLT